MEQINKDTLEQLKATKNTFKDTYIDYKKRTKLSRIEPKFKNITEHNYNEK